VSSVGSLPGGRGNRGFDQAEPPGDVARGRGLQEEGADDRQRDQGDRKLGSLDASGQEYARHGGRDDPRVAG
jgi:hypothetical protein